MIRLAPGFSQVIARQCPNETVFNGFITRCKKSHLHWVIELIGKPSSASTLVVTYWPRCAMVAIVNSLIEIDEQGVPWISGANTKVIEVVLDKMAHGSSPEEMHLQYPHLSLA